MDKVQEHEVKWYPKVRKIDQIPTEGLEYAFVSKSWEQIHQLVWCKDFMQDAIHGFVNQKRVWIYKFLYDPATSLPLYLEKTRLMITNWRDKQFSNRIPALLDFLHQVEEKLRMRKTKVVRCKNPPSIYKQAGVWVLESSKRWMVSPPMISLYTLFIRIGLVHRIGLSFEDTIGRMMSGELSSYFFGEDAEQLDEADETINKILKYGDKRLFYQDIRKNYPPHLSSEAIHEFSGLVSYAIGNTRENFPYWHRYDPKEAHADIW